MGLIIIFGFQAYFPFFKIMALRKEKSALVSERKGLYKLYLFRIVQMIF